MRELKFRAWSLGNRMKGKEPHYIEDFAIDAFFGTPKDIFDGNGSEDGIECIEQYTGLKDRDGKEIYENCELDGRYRVEYIAPKFVGKDIIKGDIIELYDNKFTITKEHCEISQNSERSIN